MFTKTPQNSYCQPGAWAIAAAVAAALTMGACGSSAPEQVQSASAPTVQAADQPVPPDPDETAPVASNDVEQDADRETGQSGDDPTVSSASLGALFYQISDLGTGVVVPGSFEEQSSDDQHISFVHPPTGLTVFVGATDELVSGNGGDFTINTWSDIAGSSAAGEAEVYMQANGEPGSVRGLIDAGNRMIEVSVVGNEQFAQSVFDNVLRDMTVVGVAFWGESEPDPFDEG